MTNWGGYRQFCNLFFYRNMGVWGQFFFFQREVWKHIGKVKIRWKLFPKEGRGGSPNCLPEPKQRDDKAWKTNCGGAEHPGQGNLHLGGGQQLCQGDGGRGGVCHPPVPHQDGQFEELKIVTVLKDNTYCSPFKHKVQEVYKYIMNESLKIMTHIVRGGGLKSLSCTTP